MVEQTIDWSSLERRAQTKAKATNDVVKTTVAKYNFTKTKIEQLKKKKAAIEKEIEDLERKQANRLKFYNSAKPKEKKN